jgi:hypothetical protein
MTHATSLLLQPASNVFPDPDRVRQLIKYHETEATYLRRLLRMLFSYERERCHQDGGPNDAA